jgi:hypothetical protein
MSKFSGPQQPGASRRLYYRRRAEAEARQAEERARDAARSREIERRAAGARPLTYDEFAEAMFALLAADAARTLYLLTGREPAKEGQS